MRIILTLLLFVSGLASASEWELVEVQDKMRGATLLSGSKNSNDGEARLVVMRFGDAEYGVGVEIESRSLSCGNPCYFHARFDGGEVKQHMAYLSNDQETLIPFDRKSFVKSVELASVLFIEVEIRDGGRKQFEFDVRNSPVSVAPDRAPSFMRHPLGSEAAKLGLDGVDGHITGCVKNPPPKQFLNVPVRKVSSVCFVGGRLSSIVFSVIKTDKKAIAKINDDLDNVLGKHSVLGKDKRWPDISKGTGKTMHTSAGHYSLDNELIYVYFDDALGNLQPPKK